MGDWRGRCFKQTNDRNVLERGEVVELKNVLYIPTLKNSLFSLTRAIRDGGKLCNEGEKIVVDFGNEKRWVFDYLMYTGYRYITGMIMAPLGGKRTRQDDGLEAVSMMKFHELSTHIYQGNLKETARNLGYKIHGQLEKCEECKQAKCKKKKIKKMMEKIKKILI